MKDAVDQSHNKNRRDEESDDRQSGRAASQEKGSLENEELADKSIESGQPEGSEQADHHQPGQERSGLAQASEISQLAPAVRAFFQETDKAKQGSGDQTV